MFDFTDGERKGKVKIVEQVKFLEEVLFRIGDYLPEEVEWEITSVRKNNNQRLDGLIIKREEENVSPILYLQPYYEKYMEGEELDDVIQEIVWQWEKEREIAIEPIELFDFEACREQLFFRLVNFSLNDELWERTPYVPWVDLALTVRWLWEEETDGIRSILITNEELKRWGDSVGTSRTGGGTKYEKIISDEDCSIGRYDRNKKGKRQIDLCVDESNGVKWGDVS